MLVAAVCLAIADGGTAGAALTMVSGSSSPAMIAFPGPPKLTYAVTLTASGQDERFALVTDMPFFGGAHPTPNLTASAGASLLVTGNPTIVGPATLLGPASFAVGAIGCSPTSPPHGTDVQRRSWDVAVPANTTSTLSFALIAPTRPPWPMTDYDVTFQAQPHLQGGGTSTLLRTQSVTVRGPRPVGIQGVRLTLRTYPSTGLFGTNKQTAIKLGRRIAISGTTSPPLKNAWITILATIPSSRRPRPVTTARTTPDGRFTAAVNAKHTGSLGLMAQYAGQRGTYAPEYTCPLGFSVTHR